MVDLKVPGSKPAAYVLVFFQSVDGEMGKRSPFPEQRTNARSAHALILILIDDETPLGTKKATRT